MSSNEVSSCSRSARGLAGEPLRVLRAPVLDEVEGVELVAPIGSLNAEPFQGGVDRTGVVMWAEYYPPVFPNDRTLFAHSAEELGLYEGEGANPGGVFHDPGYGVREGLKRGEPLLAIVADELVDVLAEGWRERNQSEALGKADDSGSVPTAGQIAHDWRFSQDRLEMVHELPEPANQ